MLGGENRHLTTLNGQIKWDYTIRPAAPTFIQNENGVRLSPINSSQLNKNITCPDSPLNKFQI
jgi:hypothetical protein